MRNFRESTLQTNPHIYILIHHIHICISLFVEMVAHYGTLFTHTNVCN
jgi:hypothetical protein